MPMPRVAVLLVVGSELCACGEAVEAMLDVMKLDATVCAGVVMAMDVAPVVIVEGPVEVGKEDVVVIELDGGIVELVVVAWTRAYSVPVVLFKLPHPYDVYVGVTPAVGSPIRTQF
jgi:hypothetical protein